METTKLEAYWIERNRLVDAVTAIHPGNAFMASGWNEPGAAELREKYSAALDALQEFDNVHGGAPIL